MPPATDWKERVPDGEDARLEALATQLRDLQRARAKGGAAGSAIDRALHAKGQLGLEAEFTVAEDVPEWSRVGLFAKASTFRGWARFSNGSGARQSDRKGDVRGLAVKLVGVEGKKIIPGLESAATQDFLMIQSAATPFRDAEEFVWFVRAAQRPALLLPRLIGRFGFRGLAILRKLVQSVSRPVPSLATSTYYSALPTRFGPYAMHYGILPQAAVAPGKKGGASPDYLAEELAARLEREPVVYDFRAQFFVDEARTPIEDASREWLEADAPWVTLARLTLPKQSPSSARGRRVAEFVEKLSFDPWHATEELRPLGNMMRARNHAYRLSTQERRAAAEPDGSERFD
jgi:hypothetical protein